MEAQARAGIDIHEQVLRYAEVEQYGSRYRLLRLGSCVFDFDLARDLFLADRPERLATVAEALSDVFHGAVAETLHVALHPPQGYSFFAPMDRPVPGDERDARFLDEAAFLVGSEEALRVTTDVVYEEVRPDGAPVDWYHVLATPTWLHARLDRMLQEVPGFRSRRLMRSMHAAAKTIDRLEQRDGDEDRAGAPYSLAIGWYPTHTEYTLCRDRRWHYGHYAPACTPSDGAYFAVALLKRLKLPPRSVGRLYLYGHEIEDAPFSVLEPLFQRAPERLNPLRLVDLDPESLTASFDAEAYLPCIGVTF